mgnify:CR=1 FL=1|tara:strand:+ start:27 stop:332 length:306 start_codon:yes stop_codon:yes gene_type:complete
MDKKIDLFYKYFDSKYHYIGPDVIYIIINKINDIYIHKLKLKYINKAKSLYRGNKYRNYYNDFLNRTDSIIYSKNKNKNNKIIRQINRINWYNYYKYGSIV